MPRAGSVVAQNYALARHPSLVRKNGGGSVGGGGARAKSVRGSFLLRRGSANPHAARQLAELTVPSRAGRSGYLLKQGAGNRAWKSRWFVLPGRDQLLLYYEETHAIVPKRIVRVVAPVAARPEAIELNGHTGYAFDVWAVEPKEGAGAVAAQQVRARAIRRNSSEFFGAILRRPFFGAPLRL